MSNLLKPNTILLVDGGKCAVGDMAGFGGVGQVYRAALAGKEVAVKWYYPWSATPAMKASLQDMIRAGPPDGSGGLFCWPHALLDWNSAVAAFPPETAAWSSRPTDTAAKGFGVVMPWRGKQFHSLADFMAGRIQLHFRAALNVALHWVEAFRLLHLKGFVFHDLSPGNLFLAESGEGMLCDIDGVVRPGAPSPLNPSLALAAPELLADPPASPSIHSDLHTLAVALCCLLTRSQPFKEPPTDVAFNVAPGELRRIYRSREFVFDPSKPAPGTESQRRWAELPDALRDYFVQTLVVGANDPAVRVKLEDWIEALQSARDRLVICPKDQAASFAQRDAQETVSATCRRCGSPLDIPLVLRFQQPGDIVVVSNDARVFRSHLTTEGSPLKAVGTLAKHPTQPNVFGLQNLTEQPWRYARPDRTETSVEPGKRVTLAAGGILNFGSALAQITTATLPLDQLWRRTTEAAPVAEVVDSPPVAPPVLGDAPGEAIPQPSLPPPVAVDAAGSDQMRPAAQDETVAQSRWTTPPPVVRTPSL